MTVMAEGEVTRSSRTRSSIDKDVEFVVRRWRNSVKNDRAPARSGKFSSYALTSLRGGTGKSTLAFNLAYEVSKKTPMLLVDACHQRNLSRLMLGNGVSRLKTTLYDALLAELANGTTDLTRLVRPVGRSCKAFSDRRCSIVPGSEQLFLLPSLLYGLLDHFSLLQGHLRSKSSETTLRALKRVIRHAVMKSRAKRIMIDTGEVFSGGTHLAWAAADALIVPVRVDHGSIEALSRTLDMLNDPRWDFRRYNEQAGIVHRPKVHAVALTHCGWNNKDNLSPDTSTRRFIRQTVALARRHRRLFSEKDGRRCIYLLDDFHSAGRNSGGQRKPIGAMQGGGRRKDGRFETVGRYQRELRALAAAL